MMGLGNSFKKVLKRPTDQERVLTTLWRAGLTALSEREIAGNSGIARERVDKALQILLKLGLVSRQQRPGNWGLTNRGHHIAGRGRP